MRVGHSCPTLLTWTLILIALGECPFPPGRAKLDTGSAQCKRQPACSPRTDEGVRPYVIYFRLASSPDPPLSNPGCTFTTPNCRSTFSRCAAIAHKNPIECPGTATFG